MLQNFKDVCGFNGLRSASLATIAAGLLVVLTGCQSGSEDSATAVTKTETPTSKAGQAAKSSDAVPTGSDKYSVTIGFTSDFGKIGAVQFNVKTKTSGGFDGARDKVSCENVSGAAMLACNNKGKPGLSCAAIDPGGVVTPVGLVRCDFLVDGALSSADFTVEVVDASNPKMEPVEVEIAVTEVVKAD